MYQAAHQWGVQPSEFWGMTIPEWYAMLESHLPKDKKMNFDVDAMKADLELSDEEWNKKYG